MGIYRWFRKKEVDLEVLIDLKLVEAHRGSTSHTIIFISHARATTNIWELSKYSHIELLGGSL